MSIFNRFKAAKPTIVIEDIAVKAKPTPATNIATRPKRDYPNVSREGTPRTGKGAKSGSSRQAHRNQDSAGTASETRQRKQSRKRGPSTQVIESDSEEDESSVSPGRHTSKKPKAEGEPRLDLDRQLGCSLAFSDSRLEHLVHAADIANTALKFSPAFGAPKERVHAELQYPGSKMRERYQLVWKKGEFDPVEEIINIVDNFSAFFLTPDEAEPFTNEDSGIKRLLQKARNMKSIDDFKKALKLYNRKLTELAGTNIITQNLKRPQSVTFELVRLMLQQTYDRAVSPQIDLLNKYENGTDYVYGELKPSFVYDILKKVNLNSKSVFVDLGSGVGNVVLQVALQIGCESWGCEIQDGACVLADAQKKEFEARCRLWGLIPGPIHLERGDIRENQKITEALKRADVVLVNNEVFTAELNNFIINLFFDLKEGCQIVSLKSFVPDNHKINSRNFSNPINVLQVERKPYATESVSWKNEGGDYYIATKDVAGFSAKYGHLADDYD